MSFELFTIEKVFYMKRTIEIFGAMLLLLLFNTAYSNTLPPTTVASYSPGAYLPGQPILFDASASFDHDYINGGQIPKWVWDFDYHAGDLLDLAHYDLSTTSSTPTHAFAVAGTYTVAARYYDDDGEAGNIVTFTISVGALNRRYYLKDHLGSVRMTVNGGGITLQDDFNSSALIQWTQYYTSDFGAPSGYLRHFSTNYGVMLSNDPVLDEGIVTVDVSNNTTEGSASLILRAQDWQTYYSVQIHPTQLVITKKQPWMEPTEATGTISTTSGTNKLTVTTFGGTITAYWNDVLVVTWTDPSPWMTGKVGFRQASTTMGWDNIVVLSKGLGTVLAYNDYDPWGYQLDGRNSTASANEKYKFTGKERDVETGYDYFGARYYDSRIGRWMSVDPMTQLHPEYSPYSYVYNNPMILVDPYGLDSIYFADQANRPVDNGTQGTSYTATIYVLQNGNISVYLNGGSTYPNSKNAKDNSPNSNTIDEGWHDYNNKNGHTPQSTKKTEKGLNIDDDDNPSTRTTTGTSPSGADVTMSSVNVHKGTSNLGQYSSRGSLGCLTIDPSVSSSFFSNFNWSGAGGVTGSSNGQIFISRGDGVPIPINKINPQGYIFK